MQKYIGRAILLSLALVPYGRSQTTTNPQILEHYKRAEAALSKGQADVATAEFKAILHIDPNNSQAYANLGVIAYKSGDFPHAVELFSSALKRNPSLWDAKAFLGLSQIRVGHEADGVMLLTEAFPKIHNDGLRIDAGVAIVKSHQESKTLNKVVDVIRDLQEKYPDNPEVLYVAYRAYSELAAQAVTALSKNAVDSSRMHQVLGESAMMQDDFPNAILEFKRAAAADPTLPGIHYQVGHAVLTNSQDAGALEEAQQQFETELRANPSDFNSENELGKVFSLESKFDLAMEHYTAALRLRPDLADAHIGIGRILMDQGKPEGALPHFQEATRLAPDNETAHFRLARAYRALGRTQDAEDEMTQFQKIRQAHGLNSPNPLKQIDGSREDE